MTDQTKFTEPAEDSPREILSPEGVEERLEKEMTFRVTLTGGGKFRNYSIEDGEVNSRGIYDTKDEAIMALGRGMALTGMLLTDPDRTMDMLLKSFGKEEGK